MEMRPLRARGCRHLGEHEGQEGQALMYGGCRHQTTCSAFMEWVPC